VEPAGEEGMKDQEINTILDGLEWLKLQFGYEDDWRVFPVVDHRAFWWQVNDKEVLYGEAPEDLENEESMGLYSSVIYTYRHLDKYIYEIDTHTMILMDTQCDNNIFLAIFSNERRIGQQKDGANTS
jgi:hypothetical protein